MIATCHHECLLHPAGVSGILRHRWGDHAFGDGLVHGCGALWSWDRMSMYRKMGVGRDEKNDTRLCCEPKQSG
jgi:hypothetical protein